MFITTATIPDIERPISPKRLLPAANRGGHSVSLGALLFLGLKGHLSKMRGDQTGAAVVGSVAHPRLAAVVGVMESGRACLAGDDFQTIPFDVFNIRTRDDLKSNQWIFFCDRFRRTASRGKQSRAVLAVTGVLREMADNVIRGYGDVAGPFSALVGYHVTPDGLAFSLVDDGCGFLTSLRRRTMWQNLVSENEALDAVVSKQATSRADQSSGGGFKQLFNGLLDLNGLVVLRTDKAPGRDRAGERWFRRGGTGAVRITGVRIFLRLVIPEIVVCSKLLSKIERRLLVTDAANHRRS